MTREKIKELQDKIIELDNLKKSRNLLTRMKVTKKVSLLHTHEGEGIELNPEDAFWLATTMSRRFLDRILEIEKWLEQQ